MQRCERAVMRERTRLEVNEYRDIDAVCTIAAYSGAPQCCMSAEGEGCKQAMFFCAPLWLLRSVAG